MNSRCSIDRFGLSRARLGMTLLVSFGSLLSACARDPSPTTVVPALVPRHSTRVPVYSVAQLSAPAQVNSSCPDLTRDVRGRAHLSWLERRQGGSTAFLTAEFEGLAWTAPELIAHGEDWFVNWADFPTLACGTEDARLATWLVKNGTSTYAYQVQFGCSARDGIPWSEPATLHSDTSATEHGFVSLAARTANGFAAVWLDGRHTEAPQDAHAGHASVGVMSLYTACVDVNGTRSGEQELDPRVCDCCQTSCAILDDGTLVVAYRDRGDDETRDIAVVSGRPGEEFSVPRSVHADGWVIAGCPVNGPVIAAGASGVAVTWFTLGANAQPCVLVALSTDRGTTFGTPVRVDDGAPEGRVDCTFLKDGTLLVTWLEHVGEDAEWRARALDNDLAAGDAFTLARVSSKRASGFLRLVAYGDGAIVAWTDTESERVNCAGIRP